METAVNFKIKKVANVLRIFIFSQYLVSKLSCDMMAIFISELVIIGKCHKNNNFIDFEK